MDEFHQLWPLMADHQRSTDAFFELLSLIRKPDGANPEAIAAPTVHTGSPHSSLTGATLEYLKCRLLHSMYPTVQVLRMLPARHCVDVSWKAVLHMTHILKRSPDSDLNMKLVNLLVHTDWTDEHLELIHKNVFPILTKYRPTVESEEYWLCWISSTQHRVLERFLQYLITSISVGKDISTEEMFIMAVSKKRHFMDTLLHDRQTEQEHISEQMRATIYIVHIIETMKFFYEPNVSRLLAFENMFTDKGLHRTIFLDLKRMCSLQSLLRIQNANVMMPSFSKCFNIIDLMYNQLALESIDYEQIAIMLKENQHYCVEIADHAHRPECESTESELFEQFTVIRMFRTVIGGTQNNNSAQIAQCKKSLQNIRTLKGFILTLQSVVTLMFLRWDHITHVDLDRTIESGSESEIKAHHLSEVQQSPIKMRTFERFGFICSVDNLSLVLKTLRYAIAKRRHSDEFANATEIDKTEFESVADVISDATWRLSLFRSSDQHHSVSQTKMVDTKMYLREHQEPSKTKTETSDEDSNDTNDAEPEGHALPDVIGAGVRKPRRRKSERLSATLPRRKPRKKVPFGRGDFDRQMSFSHSTENEQMRMTDVRRMVNTGDESDGVDPSVWMSNRRGAALGRKCVMSKMLGAPEHLMTVCMNKGDLRTTRQLIKTHALDASPLAAELDFTEKFNQTKEKLRHIFIRYRQQDERPDVCTPAGTRLTSSPTPSASTSRLTVDRIKKVAGLGFEASKITNIIAGFSTENQLHLPESIETSATLKRFRDQHPFLRQFQPGGSLQATIVCDLVLSLAHNPEIALNMFSVLTKLWSPTETTGGDGSSTQLGYFRFLRNLVEAMRITVQFRGVAISTQRFLAEDFLTINTNALISQLTREEMLQSLNKMPETEYNTLDKLRSLLPNFEKLRRSSKEVQLFHRLVHFVANGYKLIHFSNEAQAEMSPNDILELNMQATIGNMIFVGGVFPSDIETLTCGVNVNLVHSITLNLIAPIERPKDNTVLNDIEQTLDNMNNSNEDLESTKENTIQGMFECKNAVVFDYVSKHNALLSYLLQNMLKGMAGESNGVELAGCEHPFFENLLNVDALQTLSLMSEKNVWWTALSFDGIGVETVRQYLVRTQNFENSLSAIQSLKCQHRIKNREAANKMETWLIQHVLLSNPTNSIHNYLTIEHISDINTRAKCILDHVLEISDGSIVVRLIRSTLLHKKIKFLKLDYQKQLHVWLENINIYTEIALILNAKSDQSATWLDMMRTSNDSPEKILELLLTTHNFTLCLHWSRIHPMTLKGEKHETIIRIFVEAVNRLTEMNMDLFQLLETLANPMVLNMYMQLITSVRNVTVLRYIIDFLRQHKHEDRRLVHTINVSLTIIECSKHDPPPWHLRSTPLLIVEQYLMNSRFEALAQILNGARHVLGSEPCGYCFQNRNRLIDPAARSYEVTKMFSGSKSDESNTLLCHEFSQHREHCLSEDCVDSLLRIYASKALDFRVIESHTSTDDLLSQVTDQTMASMDSLFGVFIMPREAPTRSNWVRDDEASHCMCCHRAVFTMLTRRHHCRQCGRVVCHACSTQRSLIPTLYSDVRVRVCDDCHRQLELDKVKLAATTPSSESTRSTSSSVNSPNAFQTGRSITAGTEWSFSGNLRHDELLRDEFCYEFAPSVSLCLSILALHSTNGSECANFLLWHCGKFESLLRPLQPGYPNPEIDYAMVTRMLNCLALAAKVRGGPPECDVVLEHAEIIRAVVLHRCETLLPMEPLNQSSFRKLRDALVLAEKWKLALEVSLKRGFPTTGVMAAWGIACLKSGCFETAREKFQHCLVKISSEDDIFKVFTIITYESTFQINPSKEIPCIKRPTKSPPLLAEIVHILELTSHPCQPDVMARATVIRNSNNSLAAPNRTTRIPSKGVPCHEPALNILHTLSNLKHIASGIHEGPDHKPNSSQTLINRTPPPKTKAISESFKRISPNSRFYDECLFYLTSYGNHNDILAFLVKHNQVRTALKYVHYQNVEAEHFVRTLFMPYLRKGQAATVVQQMIELDETLLIWKSYIIPLCAHLERSGLLNCLYLLQILFKDPVRASMTCVRFYEKNCTTYLDLLGQSFHLANAEMHLTKELDLCQWEEIRVQKGSSRKTSTSDGSRTPMPQRSLLMKMDSKTLNGHINTINRQLEVTKFLAGCEQAGRPTVKLLPKMFMQSTSLPTLFGTNKDKMQLAILVLICGTNVTEGFGLAFRIIQDCSLDAESVYMSVTKHLANNQQLQRVEQLIDCIRGNSVSPTGPEMRLCDRILGVAVDVFCGSGVALNTDVAGRDAFERLVKQIGDVAIRISCHIAGGQLKSAYLLAVQHERDADIRRVWRKADATNQTHIRKLCERKLNLR